MKNMDYELKYSRGTIYFSQYEHRILTNIIQEELKNLWSDHNFITIPGVRGSFLERLNFENPRRIKSILNYLNTNINFRKFIANKYNKVNNYDTLVEAFLENSTELISYSGKYFNDVLEILKRTETIGIENEIKSAQILQQSIKNILAKDVYVQITDPDSYDDLIDGVDLFFDIGEDTSTIQVKPLQNISKRENQIWVQSSGVQKKYDVDFIIFINGGKRIPDWIIFNNNPLPDSPLKFMEKDIFDTNIKI